ncbi:sensor histidine kinase YesM [Paenibacillus baekrokdamisoli]|uniref:Sensor histidine kinase YesM n=2 Tax=Paenibacillus baekrokdamisoli TaxID=1712516 RepID=A0A3G9JPN6_9BACL|nr:sensor histidine kinase YesM [Paenibacillus baekrokdamisoli]
MNRGGGRLRHTIRFKLIIGVVAILVPLIGLLNFNQYYAAQVVRKQVAVSNQSYTTLYMNQIDGQLWEIDSFLIRMIVSDSNLAMMDKQLEEEEYERLKVQLSRQLTNEITRYAPVDGFLIYSALDSGLIEAFSSRPPYPERQAVGEEIVHMLSGSPAQSQLGGRHWQVREINGSYYMLRLLRAEANIYVGAWVKADSLLVPLKLIDLGESGFSLFATKAGEPMMHSAAVRDNGIDLSFASGGYSLSGSPERYLTVGELSRQGDFRLVALIPEQRILKSLFDLRQWNTVVSAGSILLLPLSLILLRRTIMLPIRRLLSAMKRIGEGHMQGIPETSSTTEEFRVVNDNFNRMLNQIGELKIHVYEEQLSKQKVELRQLQTSINPHFYLNSLNILHSLAIVRDYELIQEMSRCLVDYFRYIFRSHISFVSLGDELMHMRNYIRIQELRFPDLLSSDIEVPPYLFGLGVPPLVIQTFVENAIKHAFSVEKPFALTIRGKLESGEGEPYVQLVIEDTGIGFSVEVLAALSEGASLEREDGSRHGIWNARRRLELLYGGAASLRFSNREVGGARVEILLPMRKCLEEGEDNDAEIAHRR